jgi:hypothetical protein
VGSYKSWHRQVLGDGLVAMEFGYCLAAAHGLAEGAVVGAIVPAG